MNEAAYREPDLSVAHEGGYGIHLIRLLTDECTIEAPAGEGNLITVSRNYRREPPARRTLSTGLGKD
jgi:hypothetical protein